MAEPVGDGQIGSTEEALKKYGNNAELVLDFNDALFAAASEGGYEPNFQFHSRSLAMAHIAMHDAINSALPNAVYERYALDVSDPAADAHAAGAQAAHDVIVAIYGEHEVASAMLDKWLDQVKDENQRDRGVDLGAQAAAAVLALRDGDGIENLPGSYEPGDEPGDWQYTPPYEGFIAVPAYADVTPFALTSGDQFRPGPPPALDSQAYANAFNEVKEVGAIDSEVRTEDESHSVHFWYEAAEVGWNRVARVTTESEGLNVLEAARLFALLHIVMQDAYIAGWDGKFHYDFWRPITAIRQADTDGNAATEQDPEWEPLAITPPVQDHPSTHAALGQAASVVLAAVHGRDDVAFTMPSLTAEGTRSFESFSEASQENEESRVLGGLHFRFATDAGVTLGDDVAEFTLGNYLQPVD